MVNNWKAANTRNASDVNKERAVNLVKAVRDDPLQENCSELLAHEDIHTLLTTNLVFLEKSWGPWPYLRIVNMLLCFFRSTREDIWDLHLAFIHEMLPWMFAYDETNCARHLSYY